MNVRCLLCSVLFACVGFLPITSLGQVIFSENFQGGIPVEFTVIDEDGNTVAAQVANTFTSAWVGLSLSAADTNVFAASTSWYDPAGQADDWLITPQISIPASGTFQLSWIGEAQDPGFRDGYEVRVSTTGTAIGDFTDIVFSVEEENAAPTSRSVLLNNYAGQDIHIAFRNNSIDDFILLIDDIQVLSQPDFDAEITFTGDLNPEYTTFPAKQGLPFQAEVEVKNIGGQALSDVSIHAFVLDLDGFLVHADTIGPVASLSPDSSFTFRDTSLYTPQDTGLYFGLFAINTSDADINGLNDTSVNAIFLTDSTYSRDIPPATGIVGVSSTQGPGKVLGQKFDLRVPDEISTVNIALFPRTSNLNDQIFATVYTVDPATGLPSQPVANTFPYLITAEDTLRSTQNFLTTITLQFAGGPIPLPAGEVYVGVNETGGLLRIATSDEKFTPGATLTTANNGANWAPNEIAYDNPATTEVNEGEFVFRIRPNFNECANLSTDIEIVNDNTGSNGSITTSSPSGGTAPYFYEWSTGETTEAISGLAAGFYNLTIRDSEGCYRVYRFLEVLSTVSIEKQLLAGIEHLEVYPNPSAGNFQVDLALEEIDRLEISLYSIAGKQVFAKTTQKGQVFSETVQANIAPGLYFLNIQTSKGRVSKKLLVE